MGTIANRKHLGDLILRDARELAHRLRGKPSYSHPIMTRILPNEENHVIFSS
jgi:hypothetical protein